MTYTTTNIEGVEVEEFVTGRILRVTHAGNTFKLLVHTIDDGKVAIYLGHGDLTQKIKTALKRWAKENNISISMWGRERSLKKGLKTH